MNKKINKKIKLYTLSEIFQIIKLSIGERLISSVPSGLRRTHHLLDSFYLNGVNIFKDKENLIVEYAVNNTSYKLSLNKNSSDALVFKQIMLEKEYQYIIDLFKKHEINLNNMIDAGSNIGLSSIYVKAYFPKAKIIALEPASITFERLNKNFEKNNLTNVTALKMGLWGHSTFLKPDISFRDGLDWAFRLIETKDRVNDSIEAISVTDLINKFNLNFIDFLKIDIEGGEISIFRDKLNLQWLNKVKVIAIEIHDEFGCRDDIENLLKRNGFVLSYSGELTVGVNNKLLDFEYD